MKWWPTDAVYGDMIRVKVNTIYHYGVYVSDDEVIQFGRRPDCFIEGEEIVVLATSIDEFAKNSIVEVAVLTSSEMKKRVLPDESVRRARERLGENGYDILYNNCEHFATEIVLGQRSCKFIDDIRAKWANRK